MQTTILALAAAAITTCGGTTPPKGPSETTCTTTYSGRERPLQRQLRGRRRGLQRQHGRGRCHSRHDQRRLLYKTSGGISIFSTGGISNRTYSLSDSTAKGGYVLVNPANNEAWEATSATNGQSATGSFTINVTSNSSYSNSNGITGYYIHGTADETLTPVDGTGATGTVTVHTVF